MHVYTVYDILFLYVINVCIHIFQSEMYCLLFRNPLVTRQVGSLSKYLRQVSYVPGG